MITAREAFETAMRAKDSHLEEAMKIIKGVALKGDTSVWLQVNDKGTAEAGIPDKVKKGFIDTLTLLGYKISWDGEVSPAYAPDYKHFRIKVSWDDKTRKKFCSDRFDCRKVDQEEGVLE